MLVPAIEKAAMTIDEVRTQVRDGSHGHVIDGVHERLSSGESIPVVNPANGEIIARISNGSAADVDRAVSAANKALTGWRDTPPGERAKVLLQVADIVDQHIEELVLLESLNAGKPLMVSRAEMGMVGDVFRFAAGASRALQAPATDEYVRGHVSIIRREPLGVVGAITPWNYPLLTAVFKIAGALAVGNTMVLKPSELTPLTTLRFMSLVSHILPPGVLNIVLGYGAEVGAAISQHTGIDMVSLTGSVASGQRVIIDSAKSLKPTHLELGGKAPVVVFEDADLDKVVASVRIAGFWNTGQECGAATRIVCARSISDQLTERLMKAVSTIQVGSVTDGDHIEMGPLVSKRHLDLVSSMVEQAETDGATLALGGRPLEGTGYFFAPTIITNVPRGSAIATQEVFGPVITIETFESEEEAIEMANDVAYGLSASVWTQDVGRSFRVSSALDFGTVWVNAHLVLAVEMPWGGFNASGHGRELSTLGLDDFSRTKHVMIATQ
jgi:aminobutyraldehyde dehydrogenase